MKKLRQQIRELADENSRLKLGLASQDQRIERLHDEIELMNEQVSCAKQQYDAAMATLGFTRSNLRDRDHRIAALEGAVKQQAHIIHNLV